MNPLTRYFDWVAATFGNGLLVYFLHMVILSFVLGSIFFLAVINIAAVL